MEENFIMKIVLNFEHYQPNTPLCFCAYTTDSEQKDKLKRANGKWKNGINGMKTQSSIYLALKVSLMSHVSEIPTNHYGYIGNF